MGEERFGIQGWRQFLVAKQSMLSAFDQARKQALAHEVEVYHGKVAEFQFRNWLEQFLPKKYGVTAGYVVSQIKSEADKLPHYDVIIYDQLNAPILWLEDQSGGESASRAIPAEHVRGIIEVKSSLDSASAKDAMEHLLDLEPLLNVARPEFEQFTIPRTFFSLIVFFELRKVNEFSKKALDNFVPENDLRGYMGGLILRGEGLIPEMTGRLSMMESDDEHNLSKAKRSCLSLTEFIFSGKKKYDSHYGLALLTWDYNNFAEFAFDIVAILNETFKAHGQSSLHGLSFPLAPKEPD
jgi:hypothetical protein